MCDRRVVAESNGRWQTGHEAEVVAAFVATGARRTIPAWASSRWAARASSDRKIRPQSAQIASTSSYST